MNGPEGVRLAAPHETVAEHEAGRIDRERWAARAKERHEAHERAEAEAKQKPEAEAEEKSKQEGSSQQPEPEKKWPINAVTGWDALNLLRRGAFARARGISHEQHLLPGTVSMIGGAGGVGKNTFRDDLAYCIAREDVEADEAGRRGLRLGPLKTRKGVAWVFTEEMTDPQMRKRLRKRFTREDLAAAKPNLRFFCKTGIKINTEKDRAALRRLLSGAELRMLLSGSGSEALEKIAKLYGAHTATRPDLVFIDNPCNILGGADESSNAQMAPILTGLVDEVAVPLNIPKEEPRDRRDDRACAGIYFSGTGLISKRPEDIRANTHSAPLAHFAECAVLAGISE